MASMTIRNLEDDLKRRLRVRAAEHGNSMEKEVREILRAALCTHDAGRDRLSRRIRRRFEAFGGLELRLPEREPAREPLDLR